ncbi:MAG: hypothetical protein HY254_13440 [Burkholderiales bacterium]|nr:hypothetical protein [Burkholderiales bacterium]
MGYLRVNQVIYKGDNYHFVSPIFRENLILIEGDNGTGKTTFCNLIYYGLGGKVKEFSVDGEHKHKEITTDTNNFVELYISISGDYYQVRRLIGDGDIVVTPAMPLNDENGDVESFSTMLFSSETIVLPTHRSATNKYVFSDWILEKLGISVVDFYYGYTTFKINFNELARLIYHDQQPNPEFIYKQLDIKQNYINDSELLRKAIFELLIGKSFSDYYESISVAKNAEKEKVIAKSIFTEYQTIVDQVRGNDEIKNKIFLDAEIKQYEQQLEMLHAARNAFKRNRSSDTSIEAAIKDIKDRILENELKNSSIKERIFTLFDEKTKLLRVKMGTVNEIGQINKIIHSHDQLNLFSADTCPYCLSKVSRTAGHCVCGCEIDEKQYERFFYTSQEYKDILKSKTKTLQTIEIAIDGCEAELSTLRTEIRQIEIEIAMLRTKLRGYIGRIDEQIDIESLNDIDDKILETREKIVALTQRIETEAKLEKLFTDYELKRTLFQNAELKMKGFENTVKIEISTKVSAFSVIYNRLMTATLQDCRVARISIDNYLPVINDGEYKEASSGVSIRLMYYLTMMEMALTYSDVPFPRFLLIDTPETAGIELDNLKNCISQMEKFETFGKSYQVILTTGLNKYPDSFKDNRVLFLPNKQNSLLQRNSNLSHT